VTIVSICTKRSEFDRMRSRHNGILRRSLVSSAQVFILVSDIVGFTQFCATRSDPQEVRFSAVA
jgi:hypothetical protein